MVRQFEFHKAPKLICFLRAARSVTCRCSQEFPITASFEMGCRMRPDMSALRRVAELGVLAS
jgi:hypothetical protein